MPMTYFASIHEVMRTLIEAFLFLCFYCGLCLLAKTPFTLNPQLASGSLIATFFVLKLIGFSVNLLTLSAMVFHRDCGR